MSYVTADFPSDNALARFLAILQAIIDDGMEWAFKRPSPHPYERVQDRNLDRWMELDKLRLEALFVTTRPPLNVPPLEAGRLLDDLLLRFDEAIMGPAEAFPSALQELLIAIEPLEDLVYVLQRDVSETIKPRNGPEPPDKFRWGEAVAQCLPPQQFKLLFLLWDADKDKPSASVKIETILAHVCIEAGNQTEALRKLRERTQRALTNSNIPLTLKWESSALSLVEDR